MTRSRDYEDYLADMLEAADRVTGFIDEMTLEMFLKVIHDYFGVNARVVWKTAVEDVPVIADALRGIEPSA